MSIDTETFTLEALLEGEVQFMSGQCKGGKKGGDLKIDLELVSDPDTRDLRSLEFNGDYGKLRRVLRNLIGNAIKFTPRGRITVRARIKDIREGHGIIEIEVADTGIGIEARHLSALFHPFSQIDASQTRKSGGTGLGLAICKRMVDLMGGEISVQSEPDKGSSFRFWVPLEFSEFRAEADTAATLASDLGIGVFEGRPRILLVEDNGSNIAYLRVLLERMGCEVTVAESGESMFRIFDPDAIQGILLDIHMPGMSGLEVLKRLRAEETEAQREPTPVIMLSADVFDTIKQSCLAAGASDFLTKPAQAKAVWEALGKVLPNFCQPH